MIKIVFVAPDGTKTEVSGNPGDTVKDVALAGNVDGIIGQCGGYMLCATCHCYVDGAWLAKAGPKTDGEDDMLDCATDDLRPESRLSCQIRLAPEMNGMIFHLPMQNL